MYAILDINSQLIIVFGFKKPVENASELHERPSKMFTKAANRVEMSNLTTKRLDEVNKFNL